MAAVSTRKAPQSTQATRLPAGVVRACFSPQAAARAPKQAAIMAKRAGARPAEKPGRYSYNQR